MVSGWLTNSADGDFWSNSPSVIAAMATDTSPNNDDCLGDTSAGPNSTNAWLPRTSDVSLRSVKVIVKPRACWS